MKFDEMTKIIHKKTKGRINGQTKSLKQFREELKSFFDKATYSPAEVALKLRIEDEEWIGIAARTSVEYEYYIPETRREERKLKKQIGFED